MGLGEGGDGILILSPDTPVGADLARHGRPARRGPRGQRHAEPARRALARRDRARGRGAVRDRLAAAARSTSVAQIALPQGRGVDVEIRDPAACPRYAARVITGLQVGPSPLRDAGASRRLRRAGDFEPGRRHQLRDAGDRPPAARLRSRSAAGRDRPGPARQPRREDQDARRRRAPAAGERRGDRRRAGGHRAGGRDGRRRERGLGDDHGGPAGDGDLRSARRAPDRQAARAAQRGVASVRARRRRRRGAARQPAGRGNAGAPRRRRARRARGSIATRSSSIRAGSTLSMAGLTRLAGLRDSARDWPPKSWRPSASPARPTAADTDRRHRSDLSPRRDDRGGSRRGGHAPGRLRSRAGAVAARKRRAGPQPGGAGRSGPRRAGGHRPHRDRQLGLRPAPLAGRRWGARSPTASR